MGAMRRYRKSHRAHGSCPTAVDAPDARTADADPPYGFRCAQAAGRYRSECPPA